MKLYEHEGKELFKKIKVPVPESMLLTAKSHIKKVKYDDMFIKSQILSGKRGKRGLVASASKDMVKLVVHDLLGKKVDGETVNALLIEKSVHIDHPLYFSLTVDAAKKDILAIYSSEGGVDIEEIADKHPDKIVKFPLKDLSKLRSPCKKEILALSKKLLVLMQRYDADLVEINPLAVVKKKLVALDAKITIDDNALFRQKDFAKLKSRELTPLEQAADKNGLHYVELEGNIAVMGNGAGLVMTILDVLDEFGGAAANFADVGGGSSVEQMKAALDLLLKKKPKGVFVNIFGGITRCDEVATAILAWKKKNRVRIPLVVRMIGTNEEEGKKMLEKAGIKTYDSMQDAAKLIVKLTK